MEVQKVMDLKTIKEMEVDLGERDKQLASLEAKMYGLRHLLLEKRKTLKNAVKQNYFLEDVKRDYDNYYNALVKQKTEQIALMEYLEKYVNDITEEHTMKDNQVNELSDHQDYILRELRKIRSELNEIVG
jgi:flagellar hook-associated protein FlgK